MRWPAWLGGGGAGPAQLIGVWRGTSTCRDRVVAPVCSDEIASPRDKSIKTVWRMTVWGTWLTGTASLFPGSRELRKLALRKD